MFGIRTHEVMRVAACAGSASDSDRAAFYCSGTDGGAESEAFCGKAAGRSLPLAGSRAARIVRGVCLLYDAVSDDIDGGVFQVFRKAGNRPWNRQEESILCYTFDVSFRLCSKGKFLLRKI